jgi:hypothetical protein
LRVGLDDYGSRGQMAEPETLGQPYDLYGEIDLCQRQLSGECGA